MSDRRIESLDLLRGFAAFGVAISHFSFVTSGSAAAEAVSAICVELFFPLSGYVLAGQMLYLLDHKGELLTFYVRRWLRTIPPYLVAMTAAAVLFKADLFNWVTHALFLQHTNSALASRSFYAIAWSLAVEEWYYLLMPLFLLTGSRFRPIVLVVGFIASLQLAKIAATATDAVDNIRLFTPFRLDAIAMGFAAYLLSDRLRRVAMLTLPVAGMALVWTAMQIAAGVSGWLNLLFVDLSMLVGTSVVLLLALVKLPEATRPACDWLGRISYPVYLFHLIVLFVLGGGSIAAYLMTLTLFCVAFHIWFEMPVLRSRPVYSPGKP